ncbi:hypothetical protein PG988_003193 [Apiospora saccharicola]
MELHPEVLPANLTKSSLLFFFYHVFLPPKLPTGDDSSPTHDDILVGFVEGCLTAFAQTVPELNRDVVLEARDTMRILRRLRDSHGHLQEDALREALCAISAADCENTAISIQIKMQNAGFIIRKAKDGAVFEMFELSPDNASVMATRGRLVRMFPAFAVQVDSNILTNPEFQSSIANTMATMSHQRAPDTTPKVKKAGQLHNEERDTTSPKAVTELLASILLSFGSEASVNRIRKHTREEVSYKKSKLPWRRSPIWLLVRVTLQLSFQQADPLGSKTYKTFMLYLLSNILEAAEAQSLESDILYTMSAKIARRLTKLGDSDRGAWVESIRKAMFKTSKTLDDRWTSIRKFAEVPIKTSEVSTLNWDRDMHLDLPNLDEFLSSINRRERLSTSDNFSPDSRVQSLPESVLPRIDHSDDDYKPFQLAEIERWVAINMDRWIQANMNGPQTCENLANFLLGYHRLGEDHYRDSPEGNSRMLLTVLEIWIALDKSATNFIPLMRQYRPQIPINLFKGLLLGQMRDMERLFQAENYVLGRDEAAARLNKPSIFSSFGVDGCFSVQYFDQSAQNQELLFDIETSACADRQEKLKELHYLQGRYRKLMDLHTNSSCQTYDDIDRWGAPIKRHSSSCCHCGYHNEANNLSIFVHEWPLPSDRLQAKSTVFELDPPSAFREWRDMTVYLVDDVLKYPTPEDRPHDRYPLANYHGLSQWQKAPVQRVYPLSGVKPHINTHRYEKVIVNLSEDEVCVNNGLRLHYFDGTRDTFLSEFSPSDAQFKQCTLKLPSRSAVLTPYLLRTHNRPSGKTPNEVLAEQHLCPSHLSLAEGKALMTLSYGHEIRWLELLTQLASPRLDFGKPETATFLLQLNLQAGPNTARVALRDSHQCLALPKFCLQLSKALDAGISRIERNPEAFLALWSFIALAARGLTINENFRDRFLDLMARCRDISYRWAKLLYEKSLTAEDEEQRRQFRDMMFDIALVCLDSFNADQVYLQHILSSPMAVSILIEMSIRVHDNIELRKTAQKDPIQAVLFDRWQSLMYRSSTVVSELVVKHEKGGLDLAIKRCWPTYHRGTAWHPAPSAEYWLETSSSSLQVLYNTFTGELLVGGSPLSRLPTSYKKNPLYQPLFGRCAIDVRPSDLAGMSFLSQGTFCGREVHFGMQSIGDGGASKELLLHTHYQGSNHDLVPSRVLSEYIPEALVRDFVHWYHHETGEIELRRRSTPWTTDPNGWLLKYGYGTWTLTRGTRHIISPLSETALHISVILKPLDTVMHLHILYNPQTHQVEIQLPRLKLGFYVQSTIRGFQTLWSQQFQGMCIDENQSIGTLVGLQHKLVLRGENKTGIDNRMILIPEGEIKFNQSRGGHVDVSVVYGTASRVQSYWIDSQLGRLTDNGTLQSKLFLSYMHGLTSYCIPDPFTMHTGTEQALIILESAAVRSSSTLTEENAKLLTWIAELSPRRVFYPENLRVMQSVTWQHGLSYIAQPGIFYILAQDIVQQVQRLQFLYANSARPENFTHTHPDLVDREAIRSSALYVAGSVAAAFTTDYDQSYKPRDRGQSSPDALRAARIATKICSRSLSLEVVPAHDILSKLYKFLGSTSGKLPPIQEPGQKDFQYDCRWLANPEVVLASLWCRLHHGLGNISMTSQFETATLLASLAYSKSDLQEIVQVVYAFAAIPNVAEVPLPDVADYDLAQGHDLDHASLSMIVSRNAIDVCQSREYNIPKLSSESKSEWAERRRRQFDAQLSKASTGFMDQLIGQWPCLQPSSPTGTLENAYINIERAMNEISNIWRIWYQNLFFRRYLEEIVKAMRQAEVCPTSLPQLQHPAKPLQMPQKQALVVPSDEIFLYHKGQPLTKSSRSSLAISLAVAKKGTHDHELQDILDRFGARSSSEYQRRYLEDLRSSNLSLNDQKDGFTLDYPYPLSDLRSLLQEHRDQCSSHVNDLYESMVKDTGPRTSLGVVAQRGDNSLLPETEAIVHRSRFWPRTSRSFFLGQMQKDRWLRLPECWKQRVIAFGLAITDLQRAVRLLQVCGNEADLVKELRNVGHEEWDPCDYPEWLIMECESGILIRQVQQRIAELMMMPPEDKNAVMQLNMGEGKSSVIVPIIAAALGDGSRLIRIIVTKPQFKQMHQIFISKLAGMVGRRIYHFPISRDVLLDSSAVKTIWQMVRECKKEGGILLVQPEQLLSFQLMALEQQTGMDSQIGPELLDLQTWLDHNSRDIIDESDENFSTKFELVYTMGQQRPIEHSPTRWTLTQQVLSLIKILAQEIHSKSPKSMEMLDWHGQTWRFPIIRVLDVSGTEQLLDQLTERICSHGLDGFPISRQSEQQKESVKKYISKPLLTVEEIAAVEESTFWRDNVIHTLILLRGLIAKGVIAFSLSQKRWRVNYGMDPNRDPKTRLAVPFRAKDDPAPRAEFSHPDVAIFLTCLSYYYSGLDCEELVDAFERLKQDDQSQPEYHIWTLSAPKLPMAFHELVGVNLRDKVQFATEVFPHLRYSKGAIDYFLSKSVFAREMKEFPSKLSTSGWDLGKVKKHPTTGFSGTNDSRYTLPLTVTQLDQAEQRHTNALVLRYLLQPENTTFLMPKHQTTSKDEYISDSKLFLESVSSFEPETRVILDVGAQMVDLSNRQVAETWLEVTRDCPKDREVAQAVIFFDDEDVLTVLDRSGHSEPFQTSHFAQQTGECLVFLDEAHTRGTDLKLPQNYRAAVTLGANLPKDRLLQACMRLRKLGYGQSVVFCVPEEIRNKIAQMNAGQAGETLDITVPGILTWAISETMSDATRSVPLWLNQAVRFGKHSKLWQEYRNGTINDATDWAKCFLEDEAQSLEQRYRPGIAPVNLLDTHSDIDETFRREVKDHCGLFGPINFEAAGLHEEQERELSPEAEEERQVERPPAVMPLDHQIHKSIRRFIKRGSFGEGDRGIRAAFTILDTTSAAKHLEVGEFPRHGLWVTDDFANTVELDYSIGDQSDFFQRSVSWVLTSTRHPERLVIVSPYEVQQLLSSIKASTYVTLRLYAPRMNMNQQPLDHLTLYTVPDREVATTALPSETPSSLLNLFAGQLYLQSFHEYTQLCDLLGLSWKSVGDGGSIIEADGFILTSRRSETAGDASTLVNKTRFTRSPTMFLQIFMTNVRRNNESIEKTHVGRLLSGRLLGRDDFEVDRVDAANHGGVGSLNVSMSGLSIGS